MKPTELFTRRLVRAAPDKVFAAWTNPAAVRQWWGPPPYTCPEAEIDLRIDGGFRIANRHPDGELIWITGTFLDVLVPIRLSYTWQLSTHPPGASVVHVWFHPHDEGTQIELHHERFSSQSIRDEHADGWSGCLGRLAAFLEQS